MCVLGHYVQAGSIQKYVSYFQKMSLCSSQDGRLGSSFLFVIYNFWHERVESTSSSQNNRQMFNFDIFVGVIKERLAVL